MLASPNHAKGGQIVSATFLDAIVERNKAFVAGRAARPLPALEPLRLAIVGCYDPRLDPLFQPALGYAPGKTFLFRTAGASTRIADRDGITPLQHASKRGYSEIIRILSASRR